MQEEFIKWCKLNDREKYIKGPMSIFNTVADNADSPTLASELYQAFRGGAMSRQLSFDQLAFEKQTLQRMLDSSKIVTVNINPPKGWIQQLKELFK